LRHDLSLHCCKLRLETRHKSGRKFGTTAVAKIIEPLKTCDVLILDEFGYLALEPQVGPVLYEIIAGRYQKGATIITSNKSLANWGELIGDTALMMAIIDRLLHQGEVFYLRGSSYRLRGKESVSLLAKPDRSVAQNHEHVSV
jgi:DNA replication protein DnaC